MVVTNIVSNFRFSQFFPSSSTWLCPAGVTEVVLVGSGGSAAGGGGGGGGGGGFAQITPASAGSPGTAGGNTTFTSGMVVRTFQGDTGGGAGGAAGGWPSGNGAAGADANAIKLNSNLTISGSSLLTAKNTGENGTAGAAGVGGGIGGSSGTSNSAFSSTQRVVVIPGQTYTITIGAGGVGAGGAGGTGTGGNNGGVGASSVGAAGFLAIFWDAPALI